MKHLSRFLFNKTYVLVIALFLGLMFHLHKNVTQSSRLLKSRMGLESQSNTLLLAHQMLQKGSVVLVTDEANNKNFLSFVEDEYLGLVRAPLLSTKFGDDLESLMVKGKIAYLPEDRKAWVKESQELSRALIEKQSRLREDIAVVNQDYIGSSQKASQGFIYLYVLFFLTLIFLKFMSMKKEEAEGVVRLSESLHRKLFATLSEGVLVCLDTGKIVMANKNSEKILNMFKKDIVGQNLGAIFSTVLQMDETHFAEGTSPLDHLFQNNSPFVNTIVGVEQNNGKILWLSMSAQAIPETNKQGRSSAVISFSNVTEKVLKDRLIKQQQVQIISSAKMSALGEMAGGIAHEITNPLSVIQMDIESLEYMAKKKKNVSENAVVRVSENITKTIQRISHIITGMRSFAREGDADPFEPTSVKKLIEDTLSFCTYKFQKNGVELEVEDFDDLYIDCKYTQISQVLLNLLSNAHDAILKRPVKWVKVSVKENSDDVIISIEDSGKGIPHEAKGKLFQPFFTTKDVGSGTGLGLSISKGIVDDHGGHIWVDPKSEHTRFVLSLPKSQNISETAA